MYGLGSGSSNQEGEDSVTPSELKDLRQGLVKVFNEAFLEKLFAINEVSISTVLLYKYNILYFRFISKSML